MIMPTSFVLEASVVAIGIVLLMMDSFSKSDKRTLGWAAIIGLTGVLVASCFLPAPAGWQESSFYFADPLAGFFKKFMLLSTILTLILAMDYAPIYLRFVPSGPETPQAGLGELFTLPIFCCAGLMWLVSANDFIMIFVSLELVTITFYILVASMRRSLSSLEGGVKYLILGALSTGFLVYGITWLFGMTGTTSLATMQKVLPLIDPNYNSAVLFGFALVLVGLGFKVAAVPFQFWVPDVYQGAPTPVTAYLSVASKAAGFVVLLRFLFAFWPAEAYHDKIFTILAVIAGATLLLGNLAALQQTNLKRLMAYSSIAHAGYLLVGVASLSAPSFALDAIVYYLFGYLAMTFLSFIVLVNVAKATGGDDISDFKGLGKRSPVLALGLLVAMVSLAGLPFTVGFLGKFLIFQSAVASGHYVLVILGAITVACGFYYYLKVVRAMYWQSAAPGAEDIVVTGFGKTLIGIMCAVIIVFGIFPQPIFALLR